MYSDVSGAVNPMEGQEVGENYNGTTHTWLLSNIPNSRCWHEVIRQWNDGCAERNSMVPFK